MSLLAFTSMTAFAAINNCPVSTGTIATRTFSGGSAPTYSNIAVPGDSTTNYLASLGSAGCTVIDLSFSNFALTSTGTNEGNLPFAAGTYLSLTPTGTTQTGPDTLLFSTLQGNGTANPENPTTPTANDGVDNTKVTASQSFTTTMSYGVADSLGTGILGIVLTVNDITVQTGGSGTVSIDTCSKGATVVTGAITTAAACTAASAGAVFSTTTITLAQLASQSASISLSSHPTYVDVTQVINLTCSSCGTAETGFLTFSDQFEETPEPSTLVLLGTGLALAGFTRFRASVGADKRT